MGYYENSCLECYHRPVYHFNGSGYFQDVTPFITALPETNIAPGAFLKGSSSEPTPVFQVRTVGFSEGISPSCHMARAHILQAGMHRSTKSFYYNFSRIFTRRDWNCCNKHGIFFQHGNPRGFLVGYFVAGKLEMWGPKRFRFFEVLCRFCPLELGLD